MIIQLSPNMGDRTYEHERVYIVANKKALENFGRIYKLCKCVRRIYAAKTVQIRAITNKDKTNKDKTKKPSSQKEEERGLRKFHREPADNEDDGHTLLGPYVNAALEDNDPETASGLSSSQSRAFFKTMKKRNVTTCINVLEKLEQREKYTRPMSYIYHAS